MYQRDLYFIMNHLLFIKENIELSPMFGCLPLCSNSYLIIVNRLFTLKMILNTGFLWAKIIRRVWRYQRGNQKPYIKEEQTTQWPKEKVQKDKQWSTKHTYKTKDRVTRTLLKNPLKYENFAKCLDCIPFFFLVFLLRKLKCCA